MAKQRIYTLGQVATAIGVPRATLLSWAQRGYLQFLDERLPGEPREFDQGDVAYTAAFAALAAQGNAIDAARIMQDATGHQRAYWRKAVDAATRGAAEVYILVKRYTYKGVPEIEAELYSGEEMQAQLAAFKDPTREGSQLNGSEVDTGREAPSDHVAVFPVAAAIARAVKSLARS